jgi:hypothetical protein
MKMSNKRIAAGVLALAFVFGGVGVPAANEAGLNFDIAASAEDGTVAEKYTKDTDLNFDIVASAENRAGDSNWDVEVITNYGTCGENLTWKLDIEGTLTISGTGEMTDYDYYDAPWNNNGDKKTIIDSEGDSNIAPWELYIGDVRKLIINKGVTSIGDCAFYHCEKLTSIYIPDSVTSIGTYAFLGCKSLKSFTLPNSVTTVHGGVFSECDSLTNVTIPNSVTFMGGGVFAWCDNIESATLSNGLGGLQGTTFEGCTSLTSVTIPDNYTCIDHGAFHGCTALTSINIPNGMKSINVDAFNGCTNLKSITLPKSVTYIGNRVFDNCTNLTIYCYKGTVAETYVKDNNIAYKLIFPVGTYTLENGCTKLKWTAVPCAEKYAVYGFVSNKWQKIEECDGTSYVLNNLKFGKEYKIAVIAMTNGEWSKDFSNAITVTSKPAPNPYPIVTSEVSGNQFRLKWTTVKGAEKYGLAVYQSGKWIVKAQFAGNVTTYTSPKMNRGTYKMVVCAKLNGVWNISDINNRAITVTIA